MRRFEFVCVFFVLVSAAAVLAGEGDYDDDDPFEDRSWREELMKLADRRARAFECKKVGEDCRGVVPCCGTTQCYWRDGYSAFKSGQCVECVAKTQKCQRDSQCCTSLVCQKANAYHVDGSCDVKRAQGQECHENDQCTSGYCRISWKDKVLGQGGRCD